MVPAAATTRPRVEGDREDEILDATLELLLEVGYDRLTMDAVAKQARAGKATLYRRWETKERLVIETLRRAKGPVSPEPPDTGTLRGDLLDAYCPGTPGSPGAEGHAVLGAVLTALATDEVFAAAFREHIVGPLLARSRLIFERARGRGEIDPDVDLDLMATALPAIVMHRGFVLGGGTGEAEVARVVDHLILPAVRHTRPPPDSVPS